MSREDLDMIMENSKSDIFEMSNGDISMDDQETEIPKSQNTLLVPFKNLYKMLDIITLEDFMNVYSNTSKFIK